MADSEDIDTLSKVLQITSGCLFAILAFFLVAMNSDSVIAARELSRERRLNMCCAILVLVSMFSSFFNFFQLTEIDDATIPQSDKFVLDMSRPFEWICTCPLMQLVLVLLGGTRIPARRCWMMPSLSVFVLVMGLMSTLIGNSVGRAITYIIAFTVAMIMFYFNRQQIIEVSEGEEGLFTGGFSEFKVASIILIVSWFPFPIWYLLTPEGFGIVEDTFTIHIGWAILNVFAKFSFMLYVQKIKRSYAKELRAIFTSNTSDWQCEYRDKRVVENDLPTDLEPIVKEVMTFMGVHEKANRLMGLLFEASVKTCAEVDKLDQRICHELFLPHDLIFILRQRIRALANGANELVSGRFEKKTSKDSTDGPTSATMPLVLAMTATRDSDDVNALQQAINRAKTAGADEATLKSASARVNELQGWSTIKSYVSNSFKRVLAGDDEAGLSEMLKLAEAAGLTDLVKQGRTKLTQIADAKKRAAKFVNEGNAFFKQKKYADAVNSYDHALALQPSSAKALLNRSIANRMIGNLSAAAEDAARSMELRPDNADAHRARSLALLKLERLDEAMQECEAGLLVDPRDSRLLSASEDIQLAMEKEKMEAQRSSQTYGEDFVILEFTTTAGSAENEEIEDGEPPIMRATPYVPPLELQRKGVTHGKNALIRI